jgi:hypothetical protein
MPLFLNKYKMKIVAIAMTVENQNQKMTAQVLELEGTWEEILTHASELAGRRVRVIVLADEPMKSAEDCFPQGWYEAMTGQTLPLSELWEGINFDESVDRQTQRVINN